MIPLSVLDLVPVRAGVSSGDAMQEAVDLARLIEHIAAATSRIRVGSGGIMLPNHTPLRVAEAFHTLEALHPGRIDLGIGRAPGTDPATSRALRPFDASQFPDQVRELLALSSRTLPPEHPFATVRVVPSDVQLPPIWVLASSGETAAFAGALGLGYGFARHFSPTPPGPAVRAYSAVYQPAAGFGCPHGIVGWYVVRDTTDDESEFQNKSTDLACM